MGQVEYTATQRSKTSELDKREAIPRPSRHEMSEPYVSSCSHQTEMLGCTGFCYFYAASDLHVRQWQCRVFSSGSATIKSELCEENSKVLLCVFCPLEVLFLYLTHHSLKLFRLSARFIFERNLNCNTRSSHYL